MKGKKYGIVTYHKYFNFVNYGSMLQCYAMQQALNKLGVENEVVDYCNDALLDKDIDDPIKNMWDKRFLSTFGCRLSYPEIHKVNKKFENFWNLHYRKTPQKYTSKNFNELSYDGYIIGSDTVWCTEESEGFDDGFFANYGCMKGKNNITYSASVGDTGFQEKDRATLTGLLKNFKNIAVRENVNLGILSDCTQQEIFCSIDPTLLLDVEDYTKLEAPLATDRPYLLLYSRQYNKEMFAFAEKVAKKRNLQIIDISLRKQNMFKHKMAYNTGVEEFLTLTKNADCVVTNSYHGAIFAIQYRRDFYVFTRTQAGNKISFLLDRFGLSGRLMTNSAQGEKQPIDYSAVWNLITSEREKSLEYLRSSLL